MALPGNRIIGPNAQIPEKAKRKPPVRNRAPKSLPDLAIVTVYLDRATGAVTYDDEFSTPLETWAMLCSAVDIADSRLPDQEDA